MKGEPPPLAELDWNPCHRLIPTRFPPVSLFDRVARPEELAAVFAVQALTNPRLRQEVGELSLVPPAERVSGPGSTPVMAAFCHLNPEGSRFSDGSWGVYYGASSLEVAVAEVGHHRARFFAATQEPALEVDLRAYVAQVVQPLHDLRGPAWQAHVQPDDYATPQALARPLRAAGAWGVVYPSVRHAGGQCVGLWRPRALALPVVQGPHVTLQWDGRRIAGWYRKSDHMPL
ncbi:MAG: RES family NAD+ phosphorylase [Proteobacteria bacterium]|nr:RES family NAD+ phosphorylase [Pseudomonadota bacterium]